MFSQSAGAQKVKPEDKSKVFYGGYRYKDPKEIVDNRPVLSENPRTTKQSRKQVQTKHSSKNTESAASKPKTLQEAPKK